MHIKDDFDGGRPITQVPASWFNSVAKFLNNLIPGENVGLEKHDDGSASVIRVLGVVTETGLSAAMASLGQQAPIRKNDLSSTNPKIIAKAAVVGTSTKVAREDHVHEDRIVFTGSLPTMGNMLRCTLSPNGYGHVLSFYPPTIDKYGRITGISSTAAWTVDLLDNV